MMVADRMWIADISQLPPVSLPNAIVTKVTCPKFLSVFIYNVASIMIPFLMFRKHCYDD
jgi:hypothetical protein